MRWALGQALVADEAPRREGRRPHEEAQGAHVSQLGAWEDRQWPHVDREAESTLLDVDNHANIWSATTLRPPKAWEIVCLWRNTQTIALVVSSPI